MKYLLILVISVGTYFAYAFGQNPETLCPDAEALNPCICQVVCPECPVIILCQGVLNMKQMTDVFQKTGDFPFRTFLVRNSSFLYFPADTVEMKKFRFLTIQESTLTSFFDVAPSEASVIRDLSLAQVSLQRGVQWDLFTNLKQLYRLTFIMTTIKKIPNSFGEKMPKQIEQVHFTDTKTTSLGSSAFAPLTKLTSIRVNQNSIKKLARSMFPKPYIGNNLDFENNLISSLPEDMFDDMPNLEYINFSENKLNTYSEEIYGKLPKSIYSIYLDENPMRCDCKLKWMFSPQRLNVTYLSLTCEEPNALKGKKWTELGPANFAYCG